MKRLKDDSGQALVLVMMVLLVILLMGASMLTQGSESRKASFQEREIVQVYYIAEAGAEKALAKIKKDPSWLKGLAYNTEVTYISSQDYGDGQISSVMVKRTSDAANPTTFFIESVGQYQGAKRTIEVRGEMYDPVDFPRGVWIRSPLSLFGQNSTIDSDVTAEGAITFLNNCSVLHNITAAGDVTLSQNMTATKVTTGRDLIINNNAAVTMEIDAARDVLMDNNSQINGTVNVVRNVNVGSGAIIGYNEEVEVTDDKGHTKTETVFRGRDVYFNGSITNNGRTGMQHIGGAHAVNVSIPPFPTLEQSWYADNADQFLTGNLSGTFNVDGISYIPGNITISGTYSGAGAIVAGGKVTINGDLNRADTDSSLAIISFGSSVGIETSNNLTVYALLYSPNKITLGNGTHVHGSTICNIVEVGQNATVTDDDTMQNQQPKWITTVVKITSWKEKYPVLQLVK